MPPAASEDSAISLLLLMSLLIIGRELWLVNMSIKQKGK